MIGEGGADVMTKPPDFKIAPEAPRQRNYTPLPEFGEPTMTEPPKYKEPTMTNNDKQLTDQLMAQIMNQEGPKKPQEITSQIAKNIPQEKKSQGFWAKILEWFRNIFR